MTTIEVFNVEGKTNKKGLKQNKVYTILSEKKTKGFYTAVDQKGLKFTIWDLNNDWSKIGIQKSDTWHRPYSYTIDFKIS